VLGLEMEDDEANDGQNGKQGDVKELNAAALKAQAEAKASSS
jgi:hypothetical protein